MFDSCLWLGGFEKGLNVKNHQQPDVPLSMSAASYSRNGAAAEVLTVGTRDVPLPGAGEVLVRLHASGVNPSDWKVRKGGFGRQLAHSLVIPHSDGAGVVVQVGVGVARTRIGERVWVWNGQWNRPFGTAAQYIALPSEQVVPMSDSLTFEQAACLGIPASTAIQAVRLAMIESGMRVLVTGGAGSVGHYAIQLAKLRGASVITTVSSDEKARHALEAGADHVINYRSEDVGERIRAVTNGQGVDRVIEVDFTANAATYPACVAPHAKVVIYGMGQQQATLPTFWFMRNQVKLEFIFIYDITEADRAAGLRDLCTLLDSARLRHTVAAVLPLAEIARAHDLVEQGGVIGNVVLAIP